jgi:hypothetical protein
MKTQTQLSNGKTYKINCYVGITKDTKGDTIQNKRYRKLQLWRITPRNH